jgi:hypothetical protein
MRRALLARLERLEERPEVSKPLLLRCGWVHPLPDDYTGERHIATVRREPRISPNVEWGQFEERPGPAPPSLEDPGRAIYLTPDEMNI